MVCMKTKLPQADVGIFRISKSSGELEFVTFQKEYDSQTTPDFATSYLAPCFGDSGSGQWIKIDENVAPSAKVSRSVLVAVYNSDLHGIYNLNGKEEKGLCGGAVTIDDGKRLVGANFCTKITNEQVLEFLKINAEICKTDDDGKKCIIS